MYYGSSYEVLRLTNRDVWDFGKPLKEYVFSDGIYQREFEKGTLYVRADSYTVWFSLKENDNTQVIK